MGFVNLDSDDDSCLPVQADLSFESENYEMSILVRWKGNCEKFVLRRVIFYLISFFYFVLTKKNLLTASKV